MLRVLGGSQRCIIWIAMRKELFFRVLQIVLGENIKTFDLGMILCYRSVVELRKARVNLVSGIRVVSAHSCPPQV